MSEKLQKAYEILNDEIACIPCEASVYTLTDDEFGLIMYARDLLAEHKLTLKSQLIEAIEKYFGVNDPEIAEGLNQFLIKELGL